jgi:hypothetical protein
LNSLEGLATLSGGNMEGYDFDDYANKIYSPRAGDDIRGASPHRWSADSASNNSVFFSDGSLSRPTSARGSVPHSSGAADFDASKSGSMLPKKRSMAALRYFFLFLVIVRIISYSCINRAAGESDSMLDVLAMDDSKLPLVTVDKLS